MTISPSKFVDGLATRCRDAAVSDCVSSYVRPSGRKAADSLVRLSQWFKALPPDDRAMVVAAMTDAAHATLFGVLCVLDGVRTIDGERHTFVVMSDLEGDRQSVSSPTIDLHDLLDLPAAI